MIPAPFTFLVLALAAYRVTRLIGWDDLPPVVRARAWLTGEQLRGPQGFNESHRLAQGPEPVLSYRRPVLAHFIGCAFCVGFWTGSCFYVAWVFAPTGTLYVAGALSLAAAAGLIAKNLDP